LKPFNFNVKILTAAKKKWPTPKKSGAKIGEKVRSSCHKAFHFFPPFFWGQLRHCVA